MLAEATGILGEQSAPWQMGWSTQRWVNLFQSPEQMTKKVFSEPGSFSESSLLTGKHNLGMMRPLLVWFFFFLLVVVVCLFYKPPALFKWEWIPQSCYQTLNKPQEKLPRWKMKTWRNSILETPQEKVSCSGWPITHNSTAIQRARRHFLFPRPSKKNWGPHNTHQQGTATKQRSNGRARRGWFDCLQCTSIHVGPFSEDEQSLEEYTLFM